MALAMFVLLETGLFLTQKDMQLALIYRAHLAILQNNGALGIILLSAHNHRENREGKTMKAAANQSPKK
jgi:hypothetical protein